MKKARIWPGTLKSFHWNSPDATTSFVIGCLRVMKNSKPSGKLRQSPLRLFVRTSLYLCMYIRYTFLSNFYIYESMSGLCFQVPDPLIDIDWPFTPNKMIILKYDKVFFLAHSTSVCARMAGIGVSFKITSSYFHTIILFGVKDQANWFY